MSDDPEQPEKYFEIIIEGIRRRYRRLTTFIAIASFAVGMGGGWAISQHTQSDPRNSKPPTSQIDKSRSDSSLAVPGDTSIKAPPEGSEPDDGPESETDVQPLPGNKAVQGSQTPTPTAAPTNPPSG